MAFDEFGFHRRRTVPRWEWMGHALDSLSSWLPHTPLLVAPTPEYRLFAWMRWFLLLITRTSSSPALCSVASMASCGAVHPAPIVLFATAFLWISIGPPPCLESLDQLCPWPRGCCCSKWCWCPDSWCSRSPIGQAPLGKERTRNQQRHLRQTGDRWYTARRSVALLRAESRLRTSWCF